MANDDQQDAPDTMQCDACGQPIEPRLGLGQVGDCDNFTINGDGLILHDDEICLQNLTVIVMVYPDGDTIPVAIFVLTEAKSVAQAVSLVAEDMQRNQLDPALHRFKTVLVHGVWNVADEPDVMESTGYDVETVRTLS